MSLFVTLLVMSSIRPLAVLHPAIVSAAPAGEDAAAYVVIYNLGSSDDRLVEVLCECAERVEVHTMIGSGAERRMAVEPGLALPRDQLVEIQPGGARHLMLMNLRQPLVAGRTVSMTFRFERGGHQTRNLAVVADTRAGWSAALARGRSRLSQMDFVAGSCWRGTFPDGRQTDTHCYSPVYGDFLQDRHVVEGGPTPYSGDALYRYHVMARSIGFVYTASDGSRSTGRAVPTEDGMSFPEETHRSPDGSEMTIRSAWTRDGPDAYVVVSEARQGNSWRELWRMRMVRIGPTPPR